MDYDMLLLLKRIGKDTITYGIGGALAGIINFALLPVYTRLFSPEQFGVIELLLTFISLVGVIMGLGMDSAQSFYFFKVKARGIGSQKRLVSAILQWRLVWGSIVAALAVSMIPFVQHRVLSGIDPLPIGFFLILLAGVFLTQIMQQSAELFRLIRNPAQFIIVGLINSIVAAVVTVITVVLFQWGIFGYLVGFLFGAGAASLWGVFRIRRYLTFRRWMKHWWPKLLRFGVPLVPGAMAIYVLNTADRWFLSLYAGSMELGYYAVAARITMIITLIVTTFRKAWWPVAMEALHTEDGPHLFRFMGRYYFGAGVVAVLWLTACAPLLFKWLIAPSYFEAYRIVGILAWSPLFFGLYLIFVGGIWKQEKAYLMPLLAGSAAIINIGLNMMLIPIWGAVGAALATSIAFGVWLILTLWTAEQLWPVHYSIRCYVFQTLAGIAGSVLLFISPLSAVSWLSTVCLSALLVALTIREPYST